MGGGGGSDRGQGAGGGRAGPVGAVTRVVSSGRRAGRVNSLGLTPPSPTERHGRPSALITAGTAAQQYSQPLQYTGTDSTRHRQTRGCMHQVYCIWVQVHSCTSCNVVP